MRYLLYVVLLAFIPVSQAAEVLVGKGNYWGCTVFDSQNKRWFAKNSYRKMAINQAYEQCRKQSSLPGTCRASSDQCEIYISGQSISPQWQCQALDFFANTFSSNIYKKKYDAALAAKNTCKHNSEYPDSCYVHLIACQNLNERS